MQFRLFSTQKSNYSKLNLIFKKTFTFFCRFIAFSTKIYLLFAAKVLRYKQRCTQYGNNQRRKRKTNYRLTDYATAKTSRYETKGAGRGGRLNGQPSFKH